MLCYICEFNPVIMNESHCLSCVNEHIDITIQNGLKETNEMVKRIIENEKKRKINIEKGTKRQKND